MKIFRANSEPRLIEVLKALRDHANGWRAQIFQFSALQQTNSAEDYADILLGYIIEQLADRDGYSFVCADKDVILLGPVSFKEAFEQITKNLESHIPQEQRDKLPSPLVRIFDLGTNWFDLFEIAKEKLSTAQRTSRTNAAATKTVPNSDPAFIKENYQRLLSKGIEDRKGREKPCVLLVEDDPLSLHLAKRALEKNFTIETASNAAEARIAYLSHVPDIVFLDIGLPDASGHTLLGEFKSMDQDAFVVMLSGNSFQTDILKSMRMGAKGFIGKPFSRAKLLQYVTQSPHCAQNAALMNLH